MAMSTDPIIEENQLEIKVQGDLGDFQIVEENSESEEDDSGDNVMANGKALSTLPQDLVRASAVPVFGSVQVTKSENVHFGNNTYFHGPVTIKQIINSKEHDNPGYEKTEDTEGPLPSGENDTKSVNAKIKPLQQRLWLKVICSAVSIVFVGGILCAIILAITLLGSSNLDESSTKNSDEDASECTKVVVGLFDSIIQLILVSLAMVSFTWLILWYFQLLTHTVIITHNEYEPVCVKDSYVAKRDGINNVEGDPLLIAPTHLRIVDRTDWLAQPVEKPLDKIRLPVPWVIIQHTATEDCHTQSECVLKVRLIQMFHVESRGWYDIGYNFLVAGDGSAYLGRGWDHEGAHTLGYNKYSMGIAFIGTFNNEPPPKKQVDACKKLIARGVQLGKIAKDYKLFGHRQLASTLSPGDKLFDILKEWPHFVNNMTNVDDIIPPY